MSRDLTFIKSTDKDGITPQALYMGAGSAGDIADVLKERGSRRLLIISNKNTFEYRSVENVISKYNDAGLRTFKYQRRSNVADNRDIEGALGTYKEYNCDTIVVIGNRYDIAVGKLTAVSATNPGKPSSFAGVGNVHFDIKTLVVIKVDSTPAASTPECSFYNHDTDSWVTCFSQIMMPQIVVIDPDMMIRNNTDMVGFSALNGLCMAIEAYLSPLSARYPQYKANAAVAIYKIFGKLDSLVADNIDGYLLTRISTGGFYAGLATSRLGFGYSFFIMHAMQSRYGCEYGSGMGKILVAILKELLNFYAEPMAELARSQHFCTTSLDTVSAAQSFIESVNDIYKKNLHFDDIPVMMPEDMRKIADSTRNAMTEMGFNPRITPDKLVDILKTL